MAAYPGDSVGWFEVNHWPSSGRLIAFRSEGGPYGERGEKVCFELSSAHLALASRHIGVTGSAAEQERAWGDLSGRAWRRVGECLTAGAAAELAVARQTLTLRVAGYDFTPGESPWRLTGAGECAAPPVADDSGR